MVLLLSVALAHLPHDSVRGVAAPSALDDSLPWFLVLTPNDQVLLERSDDGGLIWAPFTGEPSQDDLEWAFMLESGAVALGGPERLWISQDLGSSWTAVAAPDLVWAAAATASSLWLATATALYELPEGGALTPSLDGVAFEALWARGDEISGLDAEGDGYTRAAGGWEARPRPGAALTAIAAGGGYAGDEDGYVWRWDGASFVPCGEDGLPPPGEPGDAEPDQIAHLLLDGPDLWAVTATQGPFLSTDGCESWIDARSELVTQYTGEGSAGSLREAAPVLLARGDALVQAGWAGAALTRDGGFTWIEPDLIPPDYSRGLAFMPGNDGGVAVGAYASGPQFTADYGRTWAAPAHGLRFPNAQRVSYPWGAAGAQDVLAELNHAPYLSRDGGYSWASVPVPEALGAFLDVQAWGTGDHLWMFPGGGGAVSAMESLDAGETWAEIPGLAEITGGAPGVTAVQALAPDGAPARCLITSSPQIVACLPDGGAWTLVHSADPERTRTIVTIPGVPGSLLWIDEAGVHRTTDWATVSDADPAEGEAISAIAAADDGTVFLATASSRLLRSLDGGASWEDTGLRPNAPVYVLAARPGFAASPELLLATHDGLFRVPDGRAAAPTLERWGSWQRVDSAADLWSCDVSGDPDAAACSVQEPLASASLDNALRFQPGLRLRTTVRGDYFEVEGVSAGSAAVAVYIDGVEAGSFGEEAVPVQGVLWTLDGREAGIADGRHVVEIVGISGDGVLFDALIARSGVYPGEPKDTGEPDTAEPDTQEPDTAEPDTGDGAETPAKGPGVRCGCRGGGSALLLLPLGALGLRRRARAG